VQKEKNENKELLSLGESDDDGALETFEELPQEVRQME